MVDFNSKQIEESQQFLVRVIFTLTDDGRPTELTLISVQPPSPAMAAAIAAWLVQRYGATTELCELLSLTPESRRETAEFPSAGGLEAALCGVRSPDADVAVPERQPLGTAPDQGEATRPADADGPFIVDVGNGKGDDSGSQGCGGTKSCCGRHGH